MSAPILSPFQTTFQSIYPEVGDNLSLRAAKLEFRVASIENTGGGGGGSGNALTSQPLSQFAATTSAQLKGVITDETGAGVLVFNNNPVLTGAVFNGDIVFSNTAIAGIRLNNLTQAERDAIPSPQNGMLIYNTTAGRFDGYSGGSWLGGFVKLSGDTMAGPLLLTGGGPTNWGLTLKSLSTASRNAITAVAGMTIWNLNTNHLEVVNQSAVWEAYAKQVGDTFTGLVQFSGTTHAGIRLNNLTTAQRDAIAAPTAGMLIWNTTTTALNQYTGAAWSTGGGGGDALTANPLSQFAATTSAQFAGVISDETGTGLVVLNTNPTIAGATFSQTLTVLSPGFLEAPFVFANLADAVVNAATVVAEVSHHSTAGTPTTNNGVAMDYSMDSSTTARQIGARVIVDWSDATHATRTSRFRIFLPNSGTLTEILRVAPASTNLIIGNFDIQASGIGVTATDGLKLTNSTAAISGTQQYSTAIRLTGQGFGTTAGTSQATDWRIYNLPVQSTVPTSVLRFDFSVAGGAFANKVLFNSDGTFDFGPGRMTMAANSVVTFSNFIVVGSGLQLRPLKSYIDSASDGNIELLNNANNGFTRLNFGGTTSSFPAIARSTTNFILQLANGTGNAGLTTGALTIALAKVLTIPAGADTRAGNAILVAGTVTVSNTTITANSIVMLTRKTSGGTLGTAITYTLSAGASFTINSDSALDTSTFSYFIIENP